MYAQATRQDVSVDVYVAGAGGTGRETLDVALAVGLVVCAFVDEVKAGDQFRGLPVLNTDGARPGAGYVVGIADPAVRRRIALDLEGRALHPVTLVHPRAVVGPETILGAGSVVMANAHVSSSVHIGAHVQIQYNATVGHESELDDFVTVYPRRQRGG